MQYLQNLRLTYTAKEAIAALTTNTHHLAQLWHNPSPQDQAAIHIVLRLAMTLITR